MDDLWVAATEDTEAIQMKAMVDAAEAASLDTWTFLASSTDREDFDTKLDLVDESINKVVSTITADRPGDFMLVSASIKDRMASNFEVIHESRVAERAADEYARRLAKLREAKAKKSKPVAPAASKRVAVAPNGVTVIWKEEIVGVEWDAHLRGGEGLYGSDWDAINDLITGFVEDRTFEDKGFEWVFTDTYSDIMTDDRGYEQTLGAAQQQVEKRILEAIPSAPGVIDGQQSMFGSKKTASGDLIEWDSSSVDGITGTVSGTVRGNDDLDVTVIDRGTSYDWMVTGDAGGSILGEGSASTIEQLHADANEFVSRFASKKTSTEEHYTDEEADPDEEVMVEDPEEKEASKKTASQFNWSRSEFEEPSPGAYGIEVWGATYYEGGANIRLGVIHQWLDGPTDESFGWEIEDFSSFPNTNDGGRASSVEDAKAQAEAAAMGIIGSMQQSMFGSRKQASVIAPFTIRINGEIVKEDEFEELNDAIDQAKYLAADGFGGVIEIFDSGDSLVWSVPASLYNKNTLTSSKRKASSLDSFSVTELIDLARKAVSEQSVQNSKGFTLDLYTASAIEQVADRMSADQMSRIGSLSASQFIDFVLSKMGQLNVSREARKNPTAHIQSMRGFPGSAVGPKKIARKKTAAPIIAIPEGVRPMDAAETTRQIGSMNVMAISGGRVNRITGTNGEVMGINLPVSNGYSVGVWLSANDTYLVQRLYRGNVKGEKSNIYNDQLGEIAYRAGMFHDEF